MGLRYLWKKDGTSVVVLLCLYILQGIPMGLSASVPYILIDKITYQDQAILSLVTLPFSLKLLWAPVVDCLYFKSVGRRKSWLIPVQLLTGLMMYIAGKNYLEQWIQGIHGSPEIFKLTCYFACLYLLMATQDIAVDGWALTLLSNENKGWASTCNTIGQNAGYIFAHIGLLTFTDPKTCNKWFRTVPGDQGIITLGRFIQFWGYMMIIMTVLVFLLKDKDTTGDEKVDKSNNIEQETLHRKKSFHSPSFFSKPQTFSDPVATVENSMISCGKENKIYDLSIAESYKVLRLMLCMRPIQKVVLILLTCRIAFGVTDGASQLMLLHNGMPKEELALLSPFMLPIALICPIAVTKLSSKSSSLDTFRTGIIMRIVVSMLSIGIIPLTKHVYTTWTFTPKWFYGLLLVSFIMQNIGACFIYVSQMSFFAQISDPYIGGTYMTLLNTIANLGEKWPITTSLWLIDKSTQRDSNCINAWAETREKLQCPITKDGYLRLLPLSLMLGVLWLHFFSPWLKEIESYSRSSWLIQKASKQRKD